MRRRKRGPASKKRGALGREGDFSKEGKEGGRKGESAPQPCGKRGGGARALTIPYTVNGKRIKGRVPWMEVLRFRLCAKKKERREGGGMLRGGKGKDKEERILLPL